LDKRVHVGKNARIGWGVADKIINIALVGKNSIVPANYVIEAGAEVGTDIIESDYDEPIVRTGQYLETRRLANEI
jgi:glucose-1-phosphate adenylyltransferase